MLFVRYDNFSLLCTVCRITTRSQFPCSDDGGYGVCSFELEHHETLCATQTHLIFAPGLAHSAYCTSYGRCCEASSYAYGSDRGVDERPIKAAGNTHPVIYETLLAPDEKKGTPLAVPELYHESLGLVFGATDTRSTTLVTGTYFLLQNPEKAEKLKKELKDACPTLSDSSPGLEALEKLPYLSAVCKESLRMAPHIT